MLWLLAVGFTALGLMAVSKAESAYTTIGPLMFVSAVVVALVAYIVNGPPWKV